MYAGKPLTDFVLRSVLIARRFSERHSPDNGQMRHELAESLHRLPTYMGMTLRTHNQVKGIAEKLKGKEHMFVLGKVGHWQGTAYTNQPNPPTSTRWLDVCLYPLADLASCPPHRASRTPLLWSLR